MARRATGAVVEHQGKDGRLYYHLRFRAYGKRRFIALGPITREQAERELRGVLVDVERGSWRAEEPAPAPEPVDADQTFHAFAEQWWLENAGELSDAGRADYRWRLENHVLPFFGTLVLSQITVAEVDRYKASKLAAGSLSGTSINMTLKLLSKIMDVALEREIVARNPAAGKRRRVRVRKPQRSYLDTAEQIGALLDAAGELDREARADRRHVNRRALLATMTFAGLRIGEVLELRWRDVDLASGRLHVGRSKTDAGVRFVRLRPALRDELAALKAGAGHVAAEAFVFGTSQGTPQTATNVRRRVLARAVERADENLERADAAPLPERLTPHSLRRTFASVLYALGENPAVVMAEMGHTDPALALRIYAQAMRRDEGEVERVQALMNGADIRRVEDPAPISGSHGVARRRPVGAAHGVGELA